tara:strand:- start:1010 stop:1192 length:183 start_codon:yes stop_codon:yes gene_type:complete
MIIIEADEPIHEADQDLIERFSEALIDQDAALMAEVLYMLDERMSGDCVCLEVECICGKW